MAALCMNTVGQSAPASVSIRGKYLVEDLRRLRDGPGAAGDRRAPSSRCTRVMERSLGGARERRPDDFRCIERSGSRQHLGARQEDFDIVWRAVCRRANAIDRPAAARRRSRKDSRICGRHAFGNRAAAEVECRSVRASSSRPRRATPTW